MDIKKLRNIRKEKGYTQRDMAAHIGCHVETIRNYERGHYDADNMKLCHFIKYCEKLDIEWLPVMKGITLDLKMI